MKMSRVTAFVEMLALSILLVWTQSSLLAQSRPAAPDHVVSPAQLQNDLQTASAARQAHLAELDEMFQSKQGQEALKLAHVSYEQVQTATRQLSDQDLARFASRSAEAQKDFAAGNLSNRDLIWILIAVVALILIIVAVR